MLAVLSPSKTLDFETPPLIAVHTMPDFLPESQKLIKELRRYSPEKLSGLMGISDKLAAFNVARYRDFHLPFTAANAKQALMAFKGDVYEGIDVESYSKADFTFAQKHVRILSGLYGLLRPLDLIQPYRLEMGIRLPNPRGKDIYSFWGERITLAINEALAAQKDKLLINLASEEYFKAIKPAALKGEVLHIVFKEHHKGNLKIIAIFAKKARGRMASFMVKNRITKAEGLKDFCEDGYGFEAKLSHDRCFTFVR